MKNFRTWLIVLVIPLVTILAVNNDIHDALVFIGGVCTTGALVLATFRRSTVNNQTDQSPQQKSFLITELERSEDRYRSFIRLSTEGIWRTEISQPISTSLPIEEQVDAIFESAYIAECNDAMAKMYGYSVATDLIGMKINRLLVPEDPNNRDFLRAFVSQNYHLVGAESHELDSLGRSVYFVNSLIGVIEDGCLVRGWGIQQDVTDRIRNQQILRQSEAQYRELAHERTILLEQERSTRASMELSSRLKDEFLLTLSHELRTPLNAILGWSQLISRQRLDSDKLRDGLAVIERNARTQAKMIDDLLDMSRIISGRIKLQTATIDVRAVVLSSLDNIRASAAAKNISIESTLQSDIGHVSADFARLSQAMWNILSNAVKYTPRDGTISVRLKNVDDNIEIIVQDSGEGLAPEFLPHVFARFRQADARITGKQAGLGVGLSIAKQLVELHGGHVKAASDGLGKGSTFTISFPIVRPAQSQLSQVNKDHTGANLDSPLHGRTILVVDDEKDARDLLKVILEEHGAIVQVVASAQEAISLLSSHNVDLVVSDISMPEEDGYNFLKRLRQQPPERGGLVPAIAVTALTRHEDRLRSLDAGFKYHVAKPINPTELVAFVDRATGKTALH